MLSIFIAIVICGNLAWIIKVLAACFSGGLITAASNTINDYYDVEIDRINKPNRPIPAGMVKRKDALTFSLFLYTAGVLLGLLINLTAFVIALSTSLLLLFYSVKLKRTVLLGNVAVSLSTALAFIYGGVAVGRVKNAVIPAVFAFMMHFGREIIKDMEDIEGDKKNRAITLPVRFGLIPAKWSATVIFFLLFILTIIPFLTNIYGIWYFLIVLLGVNSILVYTIIRMWRHSSKEIFSQLSVLLKADMIIGLLAIIAGRW
ncbi:geranylgeranylglycerol-phosphate geranylgeranyltransferase [candidate division KSB1 bacterium]|nr:geranylgeranylglycerol-phosphate geranylgeranyltransferase [candidate division KSB1 bacterium]